MIGLLKTYGVMAVAVALLLLACSTLAYRYVYLDALDDLADLRERVEYQNREAGRKLATLTAERDEKQAAIDLAATQREKADDHAEIEIERLGAELRDRPVRVRFIPDSRPRGGGAASTGGCATKPGSQDGSAASGVLPEENTRRLADALTEVETLNAAYASCRSALL